MRARLARSRRVSRRPSFATNHRPPLRRSVITQVTPARDEGHFSTQIDGIDAG
jgi:hypothetical protein